MDDVVEPSTRLEKLFIEIPEATFAYDKKIQGTASDAEIDDLFSKEKDEVRKYNKKRDELLSWVTELNSQIETVNEEIHIQYEKYQKKLSDIRKKELGEWEKDSQDFEERCGKEKQKLTDWFAWYKKASTAGVLQRIDCILGLTTLPKSIPHTWEAKFDEDERIAVIDIRLPDVVNNPPSKMVSLKTGTVIKPLNKAEAKEIVPHFHPAIMLRVAYEIYRSDNLAVINLLALNGWIKFNDPRTGVATKTYTASLLVKRDDVMKLNLTHLDPIAAFNSLKGVSAGKIIEIVPIKPFLNLDRKDSRFVEGRAVIAGLDAELNLATMDWQDFEHLIRELFERVYERDGVEVKITQASRDRGVDAVIFDPDPIKGGKFIVQAKRYTNTVDVSAVRDLCAVVTKEGASRGIMVTTSTYGADAYEFAKGYPITLLNGGELLGLLQQYGYKFKIDLKEAKRLNKV